MAQSPPPPAAPLSWEQGPMSLGGLVHTWARFIVAPAQAFAAPLAEDWRRWLMFAMLVNLVVLGGAGLMLSAGLGAAPGGAPPASFWSQLGLYFLLDLVILTFQAGFINVLIKFITRTHVSFLAIFRAACYAQSPFVITLLSPLAGPVLNLAYFVWNLALMTVATRVVYGVSAGRAVAVNLIYAVLTIYLKVVLMP